MKNLIGRAATLTGVDVTAFVLGLAAEKAREVVSSHSTIQLNLDGQRRFAELLKAPLRLLRQCDNLENCRILRFAADGFCP